MYMLQVKFERFNYLKSNLTCNIYNQQSDNLPAAGIPTQKRSVGLSSIQEVFHKVTDHVLDKSYCKQY